MGRSRNLSKLLVDSNGDVESSALDNVPESVPEAGFNFRNRIINGDMRIDQRNAGAAIAAATLGIGAYTVDRFLFGASQSAKFSAQQNQGSVTPPADFNNYLGLTVASASALGASDFYYFRQNIEGLNCADLAWGTANAKSITVSFWVRSSLTGTFGFTLANQGFARAYPATYTINAANTWEQKVITIAGDTTGTWRTDNQVGMHCTWGLGYGSSLSTTANAWNAGTGYMPNGAVSVVSTAGATWYITGVQLEVGSTATPFERRPYGTELALCQRYFEKSYDVGTAVGSNTGQSSAYVHTTSDNGQNAVVCLTYMVKKRAVPTVTFYKTDGTSGSWAFNANFTNGTCAMTTVGSNGTTYLNGYGSVGANYAAAMLTGHFTASAEL